VVLVLAVKIRAALRLPISRCSATESNTASTVARSAP